MLVLFVVELVGFLSHTTETMVVLDPSNDQLVRRRLTQSSIDRWIDPTDGRGQGWASWGAVID